MSTRTITETDCDGCGASNVPIREISVQTGRETDPAGSTEPCGVKFDLCINCLAQRVNGLISAIPKDNPAHKCWQKIKNTRKW